MSSVKARYSCTLYIVTGATATSRGGGGGHMRASGQIWAWSLLVLISLLSRNTGAVLEHRQTAAAGGCDSDNFTVVASGSLATIGGCYEFNSGYSVGHNQPIYTKTAGALEGTSYAILGSQVSTVQSKPWYSGSVHHSARKYKVRLNISMNTKWSLH